MTAYYIAEIHVHDPERYQSIRDRSNALIRRHLGDVIAADSNFEMLHGESEANRVVVIAFPTTEALRSWYDDPDYAGLKRIRDQAADVRILLVNGVDT
jgi:uncharacterized protein (DUF1330 family)